MWVKSLLCIVCVSLAASMTARAEAPRGCFQRKFDKAWLKKVEKQFVTEIQIDVQKAKEGVSGTLSVKFRDDKEAWWDSEFECLDSGETWACSTHCDGGTFLMFRGKKGLEIINQRFLKFSRNQCEDKQRIIYADAEHTSFAMRQTTSRSCKKR